MNDSTAHLFHISGKRIEVYPSAAADRPIIYLNTFSDEGGAVFQLMRQMECPDFNLVTIGNLAWNHDMAPWDIPPITKNDTPCTGGANDYLKLLVDEIIPKAEEQVQGKVLWRGIAGYSLAGLFALYSAFQTECFSRIASMSGSLWFPGLQEYVFKHELKCNIDYIYFSLGDRESHTKNPYLKSVQERTEAIASFLLEKGIKTTFQLNAGNHYKNAAQRTASGIEWMLEK